MAIKKQLKDKDGNTIYPDVGLDLDSVVYSDDPTTPASTNPWITTNDITNNAVTNGKINWGTLPKSQSTNSSYVQIGNILIQYGQISGLTSASDTTINMPKSFADTNYTLVLTNQFAESGESYWWAFVCSKAVESFAARSGYQRKSGGGGSDTGNVCNWIAIGTAAT